ncbi:flavin reductase family protein [Kitasatospora sp. NPDC028055]|uniref:flavin reductase family protein n=1 Tax=Kitasatospora sp. NPDC028055 TaxID=3155653 RepID=UPI0033CC69C6
MAANRIEALNDLLDEPREDAFDQADFRRVLGHFASGVVAVTGTDGGEPVGLLVSSFTSVSLDPPLVAFCVAHTSTSWPRLRGGRRHGICFLAAGQYGQARRLATASGDSKFHGVAWSASPAGMPVLDGALAWLECSVEAEHPAGDHMIVVARVHRLAKTGCSAEAGPMVLFRGGYGRFTAVAPAPVDAAAEASP